MGKKKIFTSEAWADFIAGITALKSKIDDKSDKTHTHDVATTSAAGLMSAVDKDKLNVTNIAYATCSSAAAFAIKNAAISKNINWRLTAGSIVTILFSETNIAENPTLNVNGTGAKNIYYGNNQITVSNLGYAGTANRPMTFMYDGVQYRFIGWGYDSDTTYTNVKLGHGYGTCSTAAATKAKVVSLGNYTLTTGGIVTVRFTYDVPAGATLNINSKGAKAIYHKNAAITAGVIKAGDTATFIYSTYYRLISIDRWGSDLESMKTSVDTISDLVGDTAVSTQITNAIGTITPASIGAAASSHGAHVSYSTTAPVMDGAASVGSASTVARSDHQHPTDTSRAAASDVAALQDMVANKMDKENPTGTGSLSLNRKADTTVGDFSVAEGFNTTASGNYSHAEGVATTAFGEGSHAEGRDTAASGDYSHAEGYQTTASGQSSHVEGERVTALGNASHAEGGSMVLMPNTITSSSTNDEIITAYNNSEGFLLAKGQCAHAEGFNTLALGSGSHAEGEKTIASEYVSHAEGSETKASGKYSHAEGSDTIASEESSHAEGVATTASGHASHAEGNQTIASGHASHAEGNQTIASGYVSHAEGLSTYSTIKLKKIQGDNGIGYSLEDGNSYELILTQGDILKYNNKVATITSLNPNASPEITITPSENSTFLPTFDDFYEVKLVSGGIASGQASHAEGSGTTASGESSHTEGQSTIASGNASHAEGSATTASNFTSHAEGAVTTASGSWAHAEGLHTTAAGNASHAGGIVTIAAGEAQTVIGKYNIEDTDNTYAFIIGNGENYYDTTDFVYKDRRSNAFAVEWDGTIHVGDKKLIDIIYPVGAVYISYVSTSPASLFGGEWTAITGRFPYFNAGTATGGSNTHTLTTAQMPAHSHKIYVHLTAKKVATGETISRLNETGTKTSDCASSANAGSGSSHNNMPAYQTLYAWRRTA